MAMYFSFDELAAILNEGKINQRAVFNSFKGSSKNSDKGRKKSRKDNITPSNRQISDEELQKWNEILGGGFSIGENGEIISEIPEDENNQNVDGTIERSFSDLDTDELRHAHFIGDEGSRTTRDYSDSDDPDEVFFADDDNEEEFQLGGIDIDEDPYEDLDDDAAEYEKREQAAEEQELDDIADKELSDEDEYEDEDEDEDETKNKKKDNGPSSKRTNNFRRFVNTRRMKWAKYTR